MKACKKVLKAIGVLSVAVLVYSGVYVLAQEETSATTDSSTTTTAGSDATETKNWKQEFSSDIQEIREQRNEIDSNSQIARQEEKKIRNQIYDALQAGDYKKAKSLKAQLKTMHQENVQQKQQDLQGLHKAKKELRSDIKDARQEGYLPPRRDRDNNPPGPKGGRGTNWENPPGPRGGPGASPDKRYYRGDNRGVRDRGKGLGQGRGQGSVNRNKNKN